LPTYKAALIFVCGSEEPRVATKFRFYAPYRWAGKMKRVPDSNTVKASAGEAVLYGPGLLRASSSHQEAARSIPPNADLTVTLTVSPAGSDLKTETVFRLLAWGEQTEQKRIWKA
jgi:hypothetical protein